MAAKLLKMREYQDLIVDHIHNVPRCAVWAGMGLGKTAATLVAVDMLHLLGLVNRPVLVLAPLRVARTTWPAEIKKWQQLSHLRVVFIGGDEKERVQAMRQRADIYTMNYENIPWLTKLCAKEWPFDMVVADESTKLKGFRLRQGAARARALATVAHFCPRFVELTGTPAPNGLIDLWGQIWFLDGGARLGRSFDAFVKRWFHPSWSGYGVVPNDFAQKQIEEKLKDVCLSLDAADYFDLEKPIVNVIYVDLPGDVRAAYEELEEEFYTEFAGEKLKAVNAAAKSMKLIQLANGAAYINAEENEYVEVHDEKLEALADIIEEAAGGSILVSYYFKSDLERLRRRFPSGRVLDKETKTIDDWNAGKISLLFGHPKSAGHGLNLQDGGNTLVFFSLNWNLEEHLQIIERIGPARQAQAGHRRPVFLHYILARNTIDDLVKERLEGKRKVQEILLEAMKRRKDYDVSLEEK